MERRRQGDGDDEEAKDIDDLQKVGSQPHRINSPVELALRVLLVIGDAHRCRCDLIGEGCFQSDIGFKTVQPDGCGAGCLLFMMLQYYTRMQYTVRP